MTRDEFISKANEKVKLIRNEKGYTQDKMSEVLGMSKKTLVQIEKGRGSLGWQGSVTLCTIFKDSEILQMTFGGDPSDLILSLAFNNYEGKHERTLGGKIWWRNLKEEKGLIIQQNIISNHYRILDSSNRRITSSFDLEYIKKRFNELSLEQNMW
ncbi:DNA-binding XRE family transcriptional regulator [Clostridium tetanomorphum]|uniref:Helix-turn-helix domain-containing protein n=1 Tax=Clostridium tetanomorphum TaxID=1553 RepID=A0A923EAN9_CLOTT|nr:helix-turn-helix domain-containing protein [Clostridium tetanomorphum]KAJ50841.1 transcriptional regulator [Clostridium tetanomorphum DSM 665]MBC2398332.1 helix-turn-helix domain-containing protein [Clostridium tetanomorphum]MBP1865484.1 DNA-binding XRE family transcriptional regulator [Clostridium tetanomorphum]NRS86430.1 DNA-binding XRE family transcriptional regulator [Clostridium tetanomorphum]NRZ95541.1 DNA-binding XRE family transcriptional regulator [Clostridium tetanomorphum]